MKSELTDLIYYFIQRVPAGILGQVCSILGAAPVTASIDFIKKKLPATNNADLQYSLHQILDAAPGQVSWDALGYGMKMAFATHHYDDKRQSIEMLWSGPAPAEHLAARRIDQALYDLIDTAKQEIWLVTFAAAKINRLVAGLMKAAERGVKIRLVLEFVATSEGQLSFDALKAFPQNLIQVSDVYFWPIEKRERNPAGRPGKLHAKFALIDDVVLISSANLTDDAFNRNLEIGVKAKSIDASKWASEYLEAMISKSIFVSYLSNK